MNNIRIQKINISIAQTAMIKKSFCIKSLRACYCISTSFPESGVLTYSTPTVRHLIVTLLPKQPHYQKLEEMAGQGNTDFLQSDT
jgi:hypothetical protein